MKIHMIISLDQKEKKAILETSAIFKKWSANLALIFMVLISLFFISYIIITKYYFIMLVFFMKFILRISLLTHFLLFIWQKQTCEIKVGLKAGPEGNTPHFSQIFSFHGYQPVSNWVKLEGWVRNVSVEFSDLVHLSSLFRFVFLTKQKQ